MKNVLLLLTLLSLSGCGLSTYTYTSTTVTRSSGAVPVVLYSEIYRPQGLQERSQSFQETPYFVKTPACTNLFRQTCIARWRRGYR